MRHLKFLIPSIVGIFLLFIPFNIDGNNLVLLSHVINLFKTQYINIILSFCTLIMVVVFTCSFIATYYKKDEFLSSVFSSSFVTSNHGITIRLTACLLYILNIYSIQVGEFNYSILNVITSNNTGHIVVYLISTLVVTYFIISLLLPLIVEFGLLEFISSSCKKILYNVFKVPIISHIPIVRSLIGEGSSQSKESIVQYYSATCFSKIRGSMLIPSFNIVSLPFIFFIFYRLNLNISFIKFYFSIIFITLFISFIISRFRIIKLQPNIEYETKRNIINTENSYNLACQKASRTLRDFTFIKHLFFKNIINLFIHYIPLVMVLGTIVLVVLQNPISVFDEEYLILNVISSPFVHILDFLSIPDSYLASIAIIVNFIDITLPSLIISSSTSEMTRYFVGVFSIVQIMYITQTAILLYESKITINNKQLVAVSIIRFVISLFLIALITHLIF